jgi:hypothetical protein
MMTFKYSFHVFNTLKIFILLYTIDSGFILLAEYVEGNVK